LSPVKLVELIYKPSRGGRVPQRARTVPPPPRTRGSGGGEEKSEEDLDSRGRGRGRTAPAPQPKEIQKKDEDKPSKLADSKILKKCMDGPEKLIQLIFPIQRM
jgi:hypothetical protein